MCRIPQRVEFSDDNASTILPQIKSAIQVINDEISVKFHGRARTEANFELHVLVSEYDEL